MQSPLQATPVDSDHLAWDSSSSVVPSRKPREASGVNRTSLPLVRIPYACSVLTSTMSALFSYASRGEMAFVTAMGLFSLLVASFSSSPSSRLLYLLRLLGGNGEGNTQFSAGVIVSCGVCARDCLENRFFLMGFQALMFSTALESRDTSPRPLGRSARAFSTSMIYEITRAPCPCLTFH